MNKEELAKRIKDRLVKIGTALKHMESIMKYSQNDKGFEDAFVILYVSLQKYSILKAHRFSRGVKERRFLSYMERHS